MFSFDNLAEAISNALSGDSIQIINHASEVAPIEVPLSLNFVLQSPFTFSINIPWVQLEFRILTSTTFCQKNKFKGKS